MRRGRTLTVIDKQQLTSNMLRIVLGGDDLCDFPHDQAGGYIKLLLPVGGDKPLKRSYTIRSFSPESQELILDFVVGGDKGPASTWAKQAVVGDSIAIDGPGGVKRVDEMPSTDWVFLAGDMTALPAISVNLERLPQEATGYAVIEVLTEADKQMIAKPEGIELHWVINPNPDQPNSVLVDAVRTMPWLPGNPVVWVASEFESMRGLRQYFKYEQAVARDQLYISSYWKMGDTDEGNKAAKKRDALTEETKPEEAN